MSGDFDPMTGESLNAKNEGAAELVTNEISGGEEQEKQVECKEKVEQIGNLAQQVDPLENFDEPIIWGSHGHGDNRESKKKVGLFVAVGCVIVLIIALTVGMVKSGLFLSPKAKVMLACKKTITEKNLLVKEMESIASVVLDDFTMAMNIGVDTATINMKYLVNKSECQMVGDFMYMGIGMNYKASLTKDQLKFMLPTFDSRVFVYNVNEDKSGYITTLVDKSELEELDVLITEYFELLGKKRVKDSVIYENVILNFIDDIVITKIDSAEFVVNGEERNCKGYKTVLTKEIVTALLDDVESTTKDTYGEAFNQPELVEVCGELREEIATMKDVPINIYLYKGKLAAIKVAEDNTNVLLEFLGGKRRTENMKLTMDDECLEVKGTTEGAVEKVDVFLKDSWSDAPVPLVNYTYDSENGDIEVGVNSGNIMQIRGNIKAIKNESVISLSNITASGQPMMASGTLSIKRGATMETIEGTEFNVTTASEEEWYQLITDISNKLGVPTGM